MLLIARRTTPRHPVAFASRVRRMATWAGKHPGFYPAIETEARLILQAWHGSYWRAGWALLGRAAEDVLDAVLWRPWRPIRRLLHRWWGWHDQLGFEGCSLCEAIAFDEAEEFRREFEAELEMPIDAGERILARARELRNELEAEP